MIEIELGGKATPRARLPGRTAARGAALVVGLVAAGCQPTEPPDPKDEVTTLRLERSEDGDLAYCPDDDAPCRVIPNPAGCAVLEVEIDNGTGDTCERCLDGGGAEIHHTCEDTKIACVLVTAPEPDCVVCARVDGAVIYSSCAVGAPYECISGAGGAPGGSGDSSGAPPEPSESCRTCWDAEGEVVLDTCRDRCASTVCPSIACAPGFQTVLRPGECCPVCVPPSSCEDVMCPFDAAVPDCPPDTVLRRDPTNCCRYYCEATACPSTSVDFATCPPGYVRDDGFPSCGACVPGDDARYCEAHTDCEEDEICTAESECLLPTCGCQSECDDDGQCQEVCTGCACKGICRPQDLECPQAPAQALDCEGTWTVPGRDAVGCPLPPVCACADGSVTLDGRCQDACGHQVCPNVVLECEAGFHLEYGYPYCCGVCVPDGACSSFAAAEVCTEIDCPAGSQCEVGPECQALCVPQRPACTRDADCREGDLCTTTWGACDSATTDCDDITGTCAPRCTGTCVPGDDSGYCYASDECGDEQICSTEIGECLPPPGCFAEGGSCLWACAGVCLEPL